MPYRQYYLWLVHRYVGKVNALEFSCVLDQMFRKAYYFIVTNDENRGEDGLYLRDVFLSEFPEAHVPEGPCSFLEFLIGVAIRLEEMLVDGECLPVSLYFWELATRLRLTEYTDSTYEDTSTIFMVDFLMTVFMDRGYASNGEGGLFPLKYPTKNQTRVEVWYQLNAYLMENPTFFEE
jgi:hypothetical protein